MVGTVDDFWMSGIALLIFPNMTTFSQSLTLIYDGWDCYWYGDIWLVYIIDGYYLNDSDYYWRLDLLVIIGVGLGWFCWLILMIRIGDDRRVALVTSGTDIWDAKDLNDLYYWVWFCRTILMIIDCEMALVTCRIATSEMVMIWMICISGYDFVDWFILLSMIL